MTYFTYGLYVIFTKQGGEEFGFGTSAMVAAGCVMARVCHLNTCPVGVCTQKPELRAKFPGVPDDVVNYFGFVAEEVRMPCIFAWECDKFHRRTKKKKRKSMTTKSTKYTIKTMNAKWNECTVFVFILSNSPFFLPFIPSFPFDFIVYTLTPTWQVRWHLAGLGCRSLDEAIGLGASLLKPKTSAHPFKTTAITTDFLTDLPTEDRNGELCVVVVVIVIVL